MKFRLLVVILFLGTLPFTASAQQVRLKPNDAEVAPPPLEKVLGAAQVDTEVLSALFAQKTEIPLGPDYVLAGYENNMTLVGQRMSSELASIAQALQSGRLSRVEAEYLIQQRYQVAMMQYEVFSALHDALEQDIAHATAEVKSSTSSTGTDTAVVVRPPVASSRQSR
jgi:hypothetical protein